MCCRDGGTTVSSGNNLAIATYGTIVDASLSIGWIGKCEILSCGHLWSMWFPNVWESSSVLSWQNKVCDANEGSSVNLCRAT